MTAVIALGDKVPDGAQDGVLLVLRSTSLEYTECVTDLDLRLKMIIFELNLTTFEASTIFWGSSENQLEPTHYKL